MTSARTSPGMRCKRERCGLPYAEHADGRCYDGRIFRRGETRVNGASQSFSAAEVETLDTIMRALLSGAELRPLARMRSAEIGSLLGKARKMKARIDAQRAERSASTGAGQPAALVAVGNNGGRR